MSLIDSLNTAVSGMTAQSSALNNISDNVANSQTVGFKGINTTFADYVTSASSASQDPSSVAARQQFTNALQGSISQVASPTSLAISGNGFFPVSQPIGTSGQGGSTFSSQPYYTRVGDFATNSAGYLVNSTGYALNGWTASSVSSTPTFIMSAVAPIQISKAPSAPVPTSEITISGNLPASPATDTVTNPYISSMQVYDADGNAQTVQLSWSQVGSTSPGAAISSSNPAVPNEWNLTITGGSPTGSPATTPSTGPMLVTFGATPTNAGQIVSVAGPSSTGTIAATVPSTQATGTSATITLPLSFKLGTQSVGLNLGTFGSTSGLTQFAGTNYQVVSQSQNGSPQGNYSSVTIKPTGDVVVNYDNGTSNTVARIPLANFDNPDGLVQQNGQTFTATSDSGTANLEAAGTGGTGTMVVGAVEASNVDIATEFTNMIVAQRAYTANSKIVTTANAMMQDTLNMVQG